jgi:transposase InsO family protein
VAALCESLHVSRAGFYAWRQERETARAARDLELAPKVCDIFWRHKRRYGARRIAEELHAQGESCGVAHVAKLLKMQGLRAIQPKSFVPKTTNSRHRLRYQSNLLLNAKPPTGVNQVWVADITYISLKTGRFAYLAVLLDLFSRRIIGWSLDDHMEESLVLGALRQAIRQRQPPANLIHHSDRGGQYAGKQYRAILRRAHVRQSMSRADTVSDNSFMESCFGTIKTELEMTEYDNCLDAETEVVDYFHYYNSERLHSSLNYLTPIGFEELNYHPI